MSLAASRNFEGLTRWLNVIGLALLFIGLRWNSCTAPLIRDEGEYAYAAQLLIQGVAPYEGAFMQKPPMVIYSYAISSLLLQDTWWAPRFVAGIFVALATVLLGLIARREFGSYVAWLSVWLVTPMILLPGIEQFAANTEMFLLLPLLGTVAVYSFTRQSPCKSGRWLMAGFLGVTTLLYKYTAAPVLVVVYAAWSYEVWRMTRSAKQLGQCWLLAMGGALIAVILELGYFLLLDGGARVWECTVRFNQYYVQSSNFALDAIWSKLDEFGRDWWILALMMLLAFVKPKSRIWFWVVMFVAAGLATGGSYYGHYYIVLMPFLALLAAVGIEVLTSFFTAKLFGSVKLTQAVVAAAVMLLVLLPDAPWMVLSPEQFARKKLWDYSPFVESPIVAARVAQLTSSQDTVFVAGSEPQILYYAHRQSPTRFVITYPLMIPSLVAQKYQLEAISDLTKRPPRLVVMVQDSASWLAQPASPTDLLEFLRQTLDENYTCVGAFVRDGTAGRWVEPVTPEEINSSSLVIYQRRAVP
jgi:hypothetical protein